jgi:hypothetical protein
MVKIYDKMCIQLSSLEDGHFFEFLVVDINYNVVRALQL